MSSLQKRLGRKPYPLGSPVDNDVKWLFEAHAEQKLCIRWSVLLGYCLVTSLNAFMFMSFCTVQDTAQELFRKDAATVNLLYSASLITAIPLMLIIWSYNVKYHRSMTWMSAFFHCAGSWTRFVAVKEHHFVLALVSSVLIGISASQIACSASVLSKLWFPVNERTAATSVSVMANYIGWLLGALLIPVYINGTGGAQLPLHDRYQRMEELSYWQAWYSIVQLVGCIGFYWSAPSESAVRAAISSDSKCGKVLVAIFGDPWFLIQMFAFSLLGGVSFGIPAAQDAIFMQYSISSRDAAYTNAAFIGTGVVTGLFIGGIVRDPRHFGLTLKLFFLIGAVSLTALHVLLVVGGGVPFSAVLLCMSLAGLASLGFIGIGLEAAALFPKVGAAASCLSIELLIQFWGALIAQVATGRNGFLICALAVWVMFLLLLFGFRSPVLSDESKEADSQVQDPDHGPSRPVKK